MNSTGIYLTRSYSAPGAGDLPHSRAKRVRRPTRGVAQPTANVARPAEARMTRVARAMGCHRTHSQRGGVTPAGEPGAKAWGGLHLKHQWGGRDPLGMDKGVGAHRGGVAPVGPQVRVVMAMLKAAVELRQETTV
jgi:hypothetical protein